MFASLLTRSRFWILLTLLFLSEIFYVLVVRTSFVKNNQTAVKFTVAIGVLFVLYALSWSMVRSMAGGRSVLLVVIAGAIVFRLTLLGIGVSRHSDLHDFVSCVAADVHGEAVCYDRHLMFDDDIWRYLWDGHVLASGTNPYLYAPERPELDALAGRSTFWTDVRHRVNHPELPTVYPPFAQMVFWFSHWVAPGSIFVLKIVFGLFDLAATALIILTLRALHLPAHTVILYAWNPLVIIMASGWGHLDSLLAALLAATAYFLVREDSLRTVLSFALAVATKIAPVILLPLLLKRITPKYRVLLAATLIGIYLPFVAAGALGWRGLFIFAYQWQFNSACFYILQTLAQPFSSDPAFIARASSGLIMIAGLSWLSRKDKGSALDFTRLGAAAIGMFLVLSPTVMPWYVVWVLPFAVLARTFIWISFSALVCLSTFMMTDWQPRTWVWILEYGLLLALALIGYFRGTRYSDNSLLQHSGNGTMNYAVASARFRRENVH